MTTTTAIPTSGDDLELEAALRAQQTAMVAREAEHDRQAAQRTLFGRVTLVSLLVILLALWITARSFDPQVFKAKLTEKASSGVSSILTSLKDAAAELTPAYRVEVERTYPVFSDKLMKVMTGEAEKLAKTITPLTSGDPRSLTREADEQLAGLLRESFPTELGGDPAKALVVASALRAQEITATYSALNQELGGPFKTVAEIEVLLKGMGPPERSAMEPSEVVDAVGTAALEVIKTRLAAGEPAGAARHAEMTGRNTKEALNNGGD